jgi:phosphoglycolate phosphatase-like HAD superfamily hydrolase
VPDSPFLMADLEGILALRFDLDGTAISSTNLNAEGWKHAGNRYGVEITPEMLMKQKGMPGILAAKMMLPDHLHHLADEFRLTKKAYIESVDNMSGLTICPGFLETYDKLASLGKSVGVFTLGSTNYLNNVITALPDLAIIRDNAVTSNMYTEKKPHPQGLLLSLNGNHKFEPSQSVYIGDAPNDYKCSQNAGTGFIFFLEKGEVRDPEMPGHIIPINDHRQIFDVVGEIYR